MCNSKKYNKKCNVLCPKCGGKGGWLELRDFGDNVEADLHYVFIDCTMCDGEGYLESEYLGEGY